MSSQVEVKPEEDARLPILEAEVEREWRNHRPGYVKNLEKENRLQVQVHATALSCVKLLNQYQEKGLNPDQAREAMYTYLIHPQRNQS